MTKAAKINNRVAKHLDATGTECSISTIMVFCIGLGVFQTEVTFDDSQGNATVRFTFDDESTICFDV